MNNIICFPVILTLKNLFQGSYLFIWNSAVDNLSIILPTFVLFFTSSFLPPRQKLDNDMDSNSDTLLSLETMEENTLELIVL